jgi:hypothetical protein
MTNYVQAMPVRGATYHAQNALIALKNGATPRMNVPVASRSRNQQMTGQTWQVPTSRAGQGMPAITSANKYG